MLCQNFSCKQVGGQGQQQGLKKSLRVTTFKGPRVRSRTGLHILKRSVSRRNALKVYGIDAAQPFDHEYTLFKRINTLDYKVGIVGFGTFGQFIAKRIAQNAREVIATSRGDYHEAARNIGVRFYQDPNDFCEEHPDIVILATSILSTEKVLQKLPLQRLRRSTLVVDVLSVKEFPKKVLLSYLPPQMDIVCTHPMFGPDSGKGSWAGLNFMYDKVRVHNSKERNDRANKFLNFFRKEGCRMVEMTCERHDELAASTQFITHTVGRVLGAMNLSSTEINTLGFESLLKLVNNTNNDSFDLYYGLFMYNPQATDQLEKMETAFSEIRNMLMTRLHDSLRQQIFHTMPVQQEPIPDTATNQPTPQNGNVSTTPQENGTYQSRQSDFLKLEQAKDQIALPEKSVQSNGIIQNNKDLKL